MNSNKPKAYQDGWVEFYKLKFLVTPDVLIPRPESELLVDEVLRFVHGSLFMVHGQKENPDNYEPRTNNQVTIIDVGTGSGNITISIAKNLPANLNYKIIATDVSAKALKVAEKNAKLHGFENRIKFIKSSLLSSFNYKLPTTNYQLIIVTNLPYIPTERISYLDSSVKDFEPRVALDGGEDGFGLYRELFAQIVKKGWQPSLLIGEIDYTHGELAYDEAYKYFPKAIVEVKKDLAKKQRILTIAHPNKN